MFSCTKRKAPARLGLFSWSRFDDSNSWPNKIIIATTTRARFWRVRCLESRYPHHDGTKTEIVARMGGFSILRNTISLREVRPSAPAQLDGIASCLFLLVDLDLSCS